MKKLYGVIGDPIAHSMSPIMHNDLFQFYQIDAHYHPFHIRKEQLQDAVNALKTIGIAGFNVTVPHKGEIIKWLDEIDPLAEAIGAVNTVVNRNGRLTGYNTDGPGFVRGLRRLIPSLWGQRVLIVGAGGAAKAIYYTLAQEGINEIDICNRTAEKAVALKSGCPFSVQTEILSIKEAEEKLNQYSLLIQTTLIGMEPATDFSPLSLENLNRNAFISDIIYNPLETKLLREAKKKGVGTQNGIDMFVYQGALAFQNWTGIVPDTARMKINVTKQLGGNPC
ncbi:shikimate dehydrogenase [Bacillus canaveralius]|uniref:Shikimate dehydrogenase (NADP(+)) n=1 Tax=Bacillus canaveralius TaxID=1403243 RepID=A0A2N5GR18_9BACI|nr:MULTISPECIES: shikimate dehydrogenase [Bacillus]PLR85869.1 shikimate dehydrogenase [Bacillus canaveralius]PLR87670.1 shikimate dehydrogenase [Bacillus sp. V33-4]PLR99987.1 shikimate dehydrogenase [Bacillus canaveralius]RSK56275.1 shikimate dehydrogenase [Bacillus canaveralius]